VQFFKKFEKNGLMIIRPTAFYILTILHAISENIPFYSGKFQETVSNDIAMHGKLILFFE